VNRPTVNHWGLDRFEIVTEFHRMEIIAEEHARVNDLFARGGIEDAIEALRPWRGRLVLRTHLSIRDIAPGMAADLPGQPRLVTVLPKIDITLQGPDAPAVLDTRETLEFAPCFDQPCALTGGFVETTFDASTIGPSRPVSVQWNGADMARVTIDFSKYE
jgi:hypothetical protein